MRATKRRVSYEACLTATGTEDAPWYAVPADDKGNAQLIVSRIILTALESLRMTYPKSNPERRQELQEIRKLLTKVPTLTQGPARF